MKNSFFYFGVCLILGGCASVSTKVTELRYDEVGLSKEMKGRIFSINCNSTADKEKVKKECMKEMANVAARHGYDYFSIAKEVHKTENEVRPYQTQQAIPVGFMNGHMVTHYVPKTEYQTVTVNKSDYNFTLENKSDLSRVKSYHKTADYCDKCEKCDEKFNKK